MISLRGQSAKRAQELARKLASSPVLPVLGYTKVAETIVAGGPTLNWLAYSLFVTGVWVFADDLQRTADEATDAVQDAVEVEN
jgi:hypothetical protein